MKRILFFVAVVSILSSCGKTTKGKMDGDWTIEAYNKKEVIQTYVGGTFTYETTISGTTRTESSIYPSSPNNTSTGTINEAVWNIKKDGTWERRITYVVDPSNNGDKEKKEIVESGSWDFLSGIGDYKKNERVSFNTLSVKTTITTMSANDTSAVTISDTYLDGEIVSLFVISESKNKSLKLELESNHVNTAHNGQQKTVEIKETYSLVSSK